MTIKREIEHLKQLRELDLEHFKRALGVSMRSRGTKARKQILKALDSGYYSLTTTTLIS